MVGFALQLMFEFRVSQNQWRAIESHWLYYMLLPFLSATISSVEEEKLKKRGCGIYLATRERKHLLQCARKNNQPTPRLHTAPVDHARAPSELIDACCLQYTTVVV